MAVVGGDALAGLAARVAVRAEVLARRQLSLLLREESAYAGLDPETLLSQLEQLFRGALRDMVGEQPAHTALAERVAQQRARDGLPLGAVLHGFRLGFSVVWDEFVASAATAQEQRALLGSVERLWSVLDTWSGAVTAAYQREHVRARQLDAHTRLRALDALLEGRPAEWQALGGAALLGLPAAPTWIVVLVEVLDQSLSGSALQAMLSVRGWANAARTEPGTVTLLVALGASADAGALVRVLREQVVERAGVSESFADITTAARAREQAALALRCVPAGERGVAQAGDDRLAALLLSHPAQAKAIAVALLGQLTTAPDAAVLLRTLTSYLEHGSTAQAAAALFCHRNTIVRRLRHIEDLTSRELSRPRDAAELWIACRVIALGGLVVPPHQQ